MIFVSYIAELDTILADLVSQKMMGYLTGILNERTEELLSVTNEETGNAYNALKNIYDSIKGVTLIQEVLDESYTVELDELEFPEGKIFMHLHSTKKDIARLQIR